MSTSEATYYHLVGMLGAEKQARMDGRLSIDFDGSSSHPDTNATLRCANPSCEHRENTHLLDAVEVTSGPLGGDCNYEADWVRGRVLAVRYECKSCDAISRLEFGQHKGVTFVRSVIEPTPS